MTTQELKMPKLDLQITKPALLLNRIAQRYSKLCRILMEYVDNSLDDAERYYNRETGIYSKPVKILIGISEDPSCVVITDNCHGMTKRQLTRLIQNVGESQKHSKFTNGQFGFGVHAFRACCKNLTVFSKTGGGETHELHIDRDSMNFHPPKPSKTLKIKTVGGSQIVLRDFDNSWTGGLSVDDIMSEIQYHFDGLLRRKNLSVVVRNAKGKSVLCRSFSYRGIEGKRLRKKLIINGNPIKVNLYVSNKPINGRTTYFTACGRRINEIYEVKSFIRVSKARYSVWNHPHVAGYIEVGDFVEPVITRDEFRRTDNRIKLYRCILNRIEPELMKLVDGVNAERRTLELGRLGNILSRCFNSAVQKDNKRLEGQASYVEEIQKDPHCRTGKRKLPAEWQEEHYDDDEENPEGEENVADEGENPPPAADGEQPPQPVDPNNPEQLQEPPKKKKKRETKIGKLRKVKGRFQMVFVKELKDAEDEVQRGVLIGDDMFVNITHPDFQERMKVGSQGAKLQITQRLNSYIANVSATSYKQAIVHRTQEGLNAYNEDPDVLLSELMDLGFSIERQLRKYLPAIQNEVTRS